MGKNFDILILFSGHHFSPHCLVCAYIYFHISHMSQLRRLWTLYQSSFLTFFLCLFKLPLCLYTLLWVRMGNGGYELCHHFSPSSYVCVDVYILYCEYVWETAAMNSQSSFLTFFRQLWTQIPCCKVVVVGVVALTGTFQYPCSLVPYVGARST